ncbi:retrovirus-related pol polyprotein from transposon TNT 1-94, partial [Trifolium medium]|nr:retrovirus-related pol polyprotein from transposon TNT 1-94 [Trifolium medium]
MQRKERVSGMKTKEELDIIIQVQEIIKKLAVQIRKMETIEVVSMEVIEVKESQDDEAKIAKQDDSDDPVMLMVTTKKDLNCGDQGYLDSGCSTHMTGRRDRFTSFNQSHKNKVKFANDSTLNAEGGVMCIRSKSGEQAFINDVLYIP